MPRYVAFLRAINVGGRIVKMDRLRTLFEELAFSNVETFIASGNVLFDSSARSMPAIERKIESQLDAALGYEVATLVRPLAALTAVCTDHPFEVAEGSGHSIQVGFLRATPDAGCLDAVMALQTPTDVFHTKDNQLFWLAKQGVGLSRITNKQLERALGGSPVTFRNLTTVRKLAAKAS